MRCTSLHIKSRKRFKNEGKSTKDQMSTFQARIKYNEMIGCSQSSHESLSQSKCIIYDWNSYSIDSRLWVRTPTVRREDELDKETMVVF